MTIQSTKIIISRDQIYCVKGTKKNCLTRTVQRASFQICRKRSEKIVEREMSHEKMYS